MSEADPITLGADLITALGQLRALRALSERMRSAHPPRGREADIADVALARAEEAIGALLRLFPEGTDSHPVPRVQIGLTGRWLIEGCALLTWISEEPATRTKAWMARGARERLDLLKAAGFTLSPANRELLENSAASVPTAEHARRPSNYVDAIALGVNLKTIYAEFCELSHWNAAWLAATADDRGDGAWTGHLVILPAFYRGMIHAGFAMRSIDVECELESIWSR